MGRELPPAEVLAADQRITAWARQLKKAGLDGSMDELRARAYLDLLLGKDSRPGQDASGDPESAGLATTAQMERTIRTAPARTAPARTAPAAGRDPRGRAIRPCPRPRDPGPARPGSPGGST